MGSFRYSALENRLLQLWLKVVPLVSGIALINETPDQKRQYNCVHLLNRCPWRHQVSWIGDNPHVERAGRFSTLRSCLRIVIEKPTLQIRRHSSSGESVPIQPVRPAAKPLPAPGIAGSQWYGQQKKGQVELPGIKSSSLQVLVSPSETRMPIGA